MSTQNRPEVEAIKDEIIATRRDIHKHPELSLRLVVKPFRMLNFNRKGVSRSKA